MAALNAFAAAGIRELGGQFILPFSQHFVREGPHLLTYLFKLVRITPAGQHFLPNSTDHQHLPPDDQCSELAHLFRRIAYALAVKLRPDIAVYQHAPGGHGMRRCSL